MHPEQAPRTSGQAPSRAAPSRRAVVGGAGAVAAGAAWPLATADTADAAFPSPYLPPIRSYGKTAIANVATRLMATRFAGSPSPGQLAMLRQAGGPSRWFEQQLFPGRVSDTQAAGFRSWFPLLNMTPQQLWVRHQQTDGQSSYGYAEEMGGWTLLRRMHSRRQVHEMMTDFWLNHFNVYSGKVPTYLFRSGYDSMIRNRALTSFENLLLGVMNHPCMWIYLDADLSYVKRRRDGTVEDRINENLGRELLELHTVGVNAGYTEEMVRDSAVLLTGVSIDRAYGDPPGDWSHGYDPDRHMTGPVRVMDFAHANDARDGRPAMTAYLKYLARHPQTAQRIAEKLCVRFVNDEPSGALVSRVKQAYLNSGTQIRPTLRALVTSPDFQRSFSRKVKTPIEDLVATVRQTGARATTREAAVGLFHSARDAGQQPFGWGPPDGYGDRASDWTSAARMMATFQMHYSIGGGFWPREETGMRYRPYTSWLPQPAIRFDLLVDHMCRLILQRPSTPRILGAACIVCDERPANIIDHDCRLTNHWMPRLVQIILDASENYRR